MALASLPNESYQRRQIAELVFENWLINLLGGKIATPSGSCFWISFPMLYNKSIFWLFSGSNGANMETTSINIENGGSTVNSSTPTSASGLPNVPPKQKRKCVIVSTCVFGLLVIIVIALGAKHRSKVTTALRNLPAAFSSASSASDVSFFYSLI